MPQSAKATYAHSLGNLILVPLKFNGDVLADKSFDEKRKLLIKNGYPLEKEVQAAQVWGQVEIEKRVAALASYAYDSVWAIK